MKAVALLTPLLALGLLLVLQRLEAWAEQPVPHIRRPPRRSPVTTTPSTRPSDDTPQTPLLRDPPPPPGYVEPLAGSTAEDTSHHGDRSRPSASRPTDSSTEHR